MKILPLFLLLCSFVPTPPFGGLGGSTCVRAQKISPSAYQTLRDLPYRPESTDPYARERCKLDLYYPTDSSGFATIVFFHGGGLEAGEKHFLNAWENAGVAVVTANYRLSPRVKNPVYTEDAAAAIAWTMQHISDYGGDPARIYLTGHSAGGYLASMVGLDTTYLATHGEHPDSLAGLLPFSGHTISHFTARKENGLAWNDVRVDQYAPLAHLRISKLPIVLITGDREKELFGRYEETAYFWRMLVASGHPDAHLYELAGFNHGNMVIPAAQLTLNWIREREAQLRKKKP